MKSKYLVDISTFELPEIDPLITDFVEKQEVYWGDDIFHMAISHNGVVYRVVTCEEGASDFIPFSELMHDHGYTDLAKETGNYKGYSLFFAYTASLAR